MIRWSVTAFAAAVFLSAYGALASALPLQAQNAGANSCIRSRFSTPATPFTAADQARGAKPAELAQGCEENQGTGENWSCERISDVDLMNVRLASGSVAFPTMQNDALPDVAPKDGAQVLAHARLSFDDSSHVFIRGVGHFVGSTAIGSYLAVPHFAVSGLGRSSDLSSTVTFPGQNTIRVQKMRQERWAHLDFAPEVAEWDMEQVCQRLLEFYPCSTVVKNFIFQFPPFTAKAFVDSALVEGTKEAVCGRLMGHCTGEHQQFSTFAECVAFMEALPHVDPICEHKYESPNAVLGLSFMCKYLHAFMVEFEPWLHCYHAGRGLADTAGKAKCVPTDCMSASTPASLRSKVRFLDPAVKSAAASKAPRTVFEAVSTPSAHADTADGTSILWTEKLAPTIGIPDCRNVSGSNSTAERAFGHRSSDGDFSSSSGCKTTPYASSLAAPSSAQPPPCSEKDVQDLAYSAIMLVLPCLPSLAAAECTVSCVQSVQTWLGRLATNGVADRCSSSADRMRVMQASALLTELRLEFAVFLRHCASKMTALRLPTSLHSGAAPQGAGAGTLQPACAFDSYRGVNGCHRFNYKKLSQALLDEWGPFRRMHGRITRSDDIASAECATANGLAGMRISGPVYGLATRIFPTGLDERLLDEEHPLFQGRYLNIHPNLERPATSHADALAYVRDSGQLRGSFSTRAAPCFYGEVAALDKSKHVLINLDTYGSTAHENVRNLFKWAFPGLGYYNRSVVGDDFLAGVAEPSRGAVPERRQMREVVLEMAAHEFGLHREADDTETGDGDNSVVVDTSAFDLDLVARKLQTDDLDNVAITDISGPAAVCLLFGSPKWCRTRRAYLRLRDQIRLGLMRVMAAGYHEASGLTFAAGYGAARWLVERLFREGLGLPRIKALARAAARATGGDARFKSHFSDEDELLRGLERNSPAHPADKNSTEAELHAVFVMLADGVVAASAAMVSVNSVVQRMRIDECAFREKFWDKGGWGARERFVLESLRMSSSPEFAVANLTGSRAASFNHLSTGNLDPAVFSDPWTFNPDRPEAEFEQTLVFSQLERDYRASTQRTEANYGQPLHPPDVSSGTYHHYHSGTAGAGGASSAARASMQRGCLGRSFGVKFVMEIASLFFPPKTACKNGHRVRFGVAFQSEELALTFPGNAPGTTARLELYKAVGANNDWGSAQGPDEAEKRTLLLLIPGFAQPPLVWARFIAKFREGYGHGTVDFWAVVLPGHGSRVGSTPANCAFSGSAAQMIAALVKWAKVERRYNKVFLIGSGITGGFLSWHAAGLLTTSEAAAGGDRLLDGFITNSPHPQAFAEFYARVPVEKFFAAPFMSSITGEVYLGAGPPGTGGFQVLQDALKNETFWMQDPSWKWDFVQHWKKTGPSRLTCYHRDNFETRDGFPVFGGADKDLQKATLDLDPKGLPIMIVAAELDEFLPPELFLKSRLLVSLESGKVLRYEQVRKARHLELLMDDTPATEFAAHVGSFITQTTRIRYSAWSLLSVPFDHREAYSEDASEAPATFWMVALTFMIMPV